MVEDSIKNDVQRWSQSLIDGLHEGVCVLDGDGAILAANGAWGELASELFDDCTHARVGGNYFAARTGPPGHGSETCKRFDAGLRAVLDGEDRQFGLETRWECASGKRWLRLKVSGAEFAGRRLAIVAHQDITGSKRALEAVQAIEYRLRSSLDGMLEGCRILDRNWIYLYINEAGARHGRKRPEDLLGRYFLTAYPGIESSEIFARYRIAMEQRIPQRFETSWTFSDGSTEWYDFSVTPVPEGIFVLTLLITDRKRAEAELLRMNGELEARVESRTGELERANRELGAFSYSVSHDLRAPLRTISGFADIVIEDNRDKLDQRTLGYLDRIKAGAARMGRLIDDLLELSRVSQQALNKQTVNLSELAHRVIESLRAAGPVREVQVAIQPGMTALADSGLATVALENLLGNAWKFTTRTAAPAISFGSRETGSGTVYFVSDNGAGFDMQFAHQLFNAFGRLHSPQQFEGTGIGLSIVQRIVTKHGGRIWANARPGAGATFHFTLDGRPADAGAA